MFKTKFLQLQFKFCVSPFRSRKHFLEMRIKINSIKTKRSERKFPKIVYLIFNIQILLRIGSFLKVFMRKFINTNHGKH